MLRPIRARKHSKRTVPYRTTPHYAAQHGTLLYRIIPHHIVACRTVHHTLPYRTTTYRMVLIHTAPHHAADTMPYCSILYRTTQRHSRTASYRAASYRSVPYPISQDRAASYRIASNRTAFYPVPNHHSQR